MPGIGTEGIHGGPTFAHRVCATTAHSGEFLEWELYRAVQLSSSEQPLSRNVERFRGGLVFKAHRLLYHSTLSLRVIKKKRKSLVVLLERLPGAGGSEDLGQLGQDEPASG